MIELFILILLFLNLFFIWLIYSKLNSKVENLKDLYFGIKEKTEILKTGVESLQEIKKDFQKIYITEEIVRKINEDFVILSSPYRANLRL